MIIIICETPRGCGGLVGLMTWVEVNAAPELIHTPPLRLKQKSADRTALNTDMYCLLKCSPLILAVAVCHGWLFGDFVGKQKELDEISLWPLPQKFQSSAVAFKLSPGSFQIVHAKQSSAGPSCGLLENAFRRYELYSPLFTFEPVLCYKRA